MPTISGLPDAMSDVVSLVRMRGEFVCANVCCAPFSLSFQQPIGHFHILERGSVWLGVEREPAVRVESGDLVFLPLGAGHIVSSDPSLPPVAIERALEQAPRSGSVYRFGGQGEASQLVCGQFSFDGVLAPKLLTVLPPLIHIRAQKGRPLEWLRLTSDFLAREARGVQPGAAIMIARLLDLLFIQALRDWGGHSPGNLGWLSALIDPQIGKALAVMHEEPARDWTVESLAAVASQSRSAFAARFLAVVGQPPLQYLTSWRLNLAADQLRAGTARIAQIANAVGYGSEAALTRAFKTQFGTTPRAFARGARWRPESTTNA